MATVEESRAVRSPRGAEVEGPPEPQLFRFGLRRFLWFVTGAVLLLGAMAAIGGGWAVGLGFLAAMIVAHVSATFVGTRLRESAVDGRASRAERSRSGAEGAASGRPLTPAELAAFCATPLARHERATGRTIAAALVGLAVGAALGVWGILQLAGPETTGAGLALGASSCGVMGAWMALLGAHFLSVMRRTWRDASADPAGATRRRKRLFGRVLRG